MQGSTNQGNGGRVPSAWKKVVLLQRGEAPDALQATNGTALRAIFIFNFDMKVTKTKVIIFFKLL